MPGLLTSDMVGKTSTPFDSEFGDLIVKDQQPQDEQPVGQEAVQQPPVREVPVREHVRHIPPPKPKEYVREVDLGDGSGKQVFKAASQEELLDKLTEAQVNASRRIKELKQQLVMAPRKELPRKQVQSLQPKQLSGDEEFLLGQDLTRKPAEAFDKLFEARVGMSVADFRTRTAMQDQAMQAQNEAAKFIKAHTEDFYPTTKNLAQIEQYLDAQGLAITQDAIEYAYQQLSTNGLLESKPQAVTPSVEPERSSEPQPKRKVMTGLSSQSQAQKIVVNPEVPSDDEIWNLPLAEARERISRALHRQRMNPDSQ